MKRTVSESTKTNSRVDQYLSYDCPESERQKKIYQLLQQSVQDCETWMEHVRVLSSKYFSILKCIKNVDPDEIVDSEALLYYSFELFRVLCLTNVKLHILITGEVHRNFQIQLQHNSKLTEIGEKSLRSELSPISIHLCIENKITLSVVSEL
jgi:hypothetical protein